MNIFKSHTVTKLHWNS